MRVTDLTLAEFKAKYKDSERVEFKLSGRKELVPCNKQTIVIGDNNMLVLRIIVPTVVDGVDVSEFDYVVKIKKSEALLELLPYVEVLGDRVILETPVGDKLTNRDGFLSLSISGISKDRELRFNSLTSQLNVRDTITVGEAFTEDTATALIETARQMIINVIDSVADDNEEAIARYVREYMEANPSIDYHDVMNKPMIENVELVGNKTFDDLGHSPISATRLGNILK